MTNSLFPQDQSRGLLEGFKPLDSVIDNETYKNKKNELFEEKLKLEKDLMNLKTEGTSPLEPFRKFTKDAFLASEIARAKNTNEVLRNFAKAVGQNFFLKNRVFSFRTKRALTRSFRSSQLSPLPPPSRRKAFW